ncbi:integrase, catalytic region, zinc finger, CCHC-type containing protein [Tanacetum coccineum]
MQTFTVFKNESKEKESKYMDKEIDLEKKIKELDNIVYKQSAQTVHMLTKPQVFYDDTYKQALGYQNSFYLKKAQKPTLYDGSVISSQHAACPVIDDEETLILEEVSRSKMLAKQNDPMSKEKKVNTTLINYVELNQLSEDFGKHFVPQQELSDEQAFWLQTSHPNNDQSASSPVKIEAPRELPKVSLVNTSLKKLKYHLGQFDNVVKKRITPDAITQGEWGFEHTKAVFLKKIIPFLKTLKDIFNVFDKDLLNKVTEVQTIFNQMEAVVQQYFVDKQCFKIHKKKLFLENDRLLQKIMSQDVMICVMNSTAVFYDVHLEIQSSESCVKCLNLDAELLNKQNAYNDLSKSYSKLEKHCISLEFKTSNSRQGFCDNIIRNHFQKLKGKETVENVAQIPIATTIAPGMFKIDLDPLAPSLLQNREARIYYLKYTHKQADILRGIVKQAKAKQPLDNALDFACNKKNDRISQKPSSNRKNKVEAQPRKVNKKNCVKEPICDVNVKHNMLNANSQLICVKCKQCMFDSNHDVCFLNFVNDVNMHAKSKSKSKESQQHNIWKPTGKVFTEVGHKWKLTERLFTIVGNSCPLTRITPKTIVHLKETTSNSGETQKPEIKVYNRRPKQVKSVGSSKKVKIIESKIVNNSEPTHLWDPMLQMFHLLLLLSMIGIVRFRNDQVPKIMGYGDYQLGNVIISRVYYVEGLGHNLFYVGKFCDADLEVAFRKNTCFIQNLEGVDLLSGSRDTNLYTISLDDMLKTSPICLLSKASKTKSWLWHRRLSHLNFDTLNKLAKDHLAQGTPKLKF